MHDRHPGTTFDATIKVEHLLRYPEALPELAEAGCAFVVSAFESVNDRILALLDKGHTVADMSEVVIALRAHGIEVRPSWLPFTPWTTLDDVVGLVDFVVAHDLVANVDPVQYSVRLLVPDGSLLLAGPAMAPHLAGYDAGPAGLDLGPSRPGRRPSPGGDRRPGRGAHRAGDRGDLRPGRGAGPLVRARRPGAPGPGIGFDRSRGRAGPAHRAVVLLFRTDRGSARPAGPVRLRPAAPSLPRRAAHSMVEPLRIAGVLVTEVVKRSPDGTGR